MTDVRAARSLPNVAAFVRMLRVGEGTGGDDGYTLINGGAHFTDFSRHPYEGQSAPPGKAAGVGQFIPHTWGRVAKRYSLPDFSPPSQDVAFVACIEEAGALDDVIAGRWADAVAKCRPVWTSLPGASQAGKWTMADAFAIYRQWGGRLEADTVQPSAPIEDRGVPLPTRPYNPEQDAPPDAPQPSQGAPMNAILLPLIQSLITGFAPLAQQTVQAALDKHGVEGTAGSAIMDALLGAVAAVTGTKLDVLKSSPSAAIAAVGAVQSDAVKLQAVQSAALDNLERLLPIADRIHAMELEQRAADEASAAAAGARNAAMAAQPEGPLKNPAFVIAMFVLFMVACTVTTVLWKDVVAALLGLDKIAGFSPEIQAFVVGAIVGAALTAILQYFIGTTKNSTAKDVLIGNLANAKENA